MFHERNTDNFWEKILAQEFEFRKGQEFSLLHMVHSGPGADTALCTWVSGLFLRGQSGRAWSWLLTSNWCRGQEKANLYIHYSIYLHGMVLN
jgi:hypothetical protein